MSHCGPTWTRRYPMRLFWARVGYYLCTISKVRIFQSRFPEDIKDPEFKAHYEEDFEHPENAASTQPPADNLAGPIRNFR